MQPKPFEHNTGMQTYDAIQRYTQSESRYWRVWMLVVDADSQGYRRGNP